MTRSLSALACLGLLLTAAACGGDDEPDAAASPDASTTSPAGTPPATSAPSAAPDSVAPADPRTGADYCQTVELLVGYVHDDYGLDASTQTVDGELFAERLATVAETYGRLAGFTTGEPASAWSALAEATTEAGDVLQAAANDVQSETVIGQLAQLAAVTQEQLPLATSNTQQECGIDPAELTTVRAAASAS